MFIANSDNLGAIVDLSIRILHLVLFISMFTGSPFAIVSDLDNFRPFLYKCVP